MTVDSNATTGLLLARAFFTSVEYTNCPVHKKNDSALFMRLKMQHWMVPCFLSPSPLSQVVQCDIISLRNQERLRKTHCLLGGRQKNVCWPSSVTNSSHAEADLALSIETCSSWSRTENPDSPNYGCVFAKKCAKVKKSLSFWNSFNVETSKSETLTTFNFVSPTTVQPRWFTLLCTPTQCSFLSTQTHTQQARSVSAKAARSHDPSSDRCPPLWLPRGLAPPLGKNCNGVVHALLLAKNKTFGLIFFFFFLLISILHLKIGTTYREQIDKEMKVKHSSGVKNKRKLPNLRELPKKIILGNVTEKTRLRWSLPQPMPGRGRGGGIFHNNNNTHEDMPDDGDDDDADIFCGRFSSYLPLLCSGAHRAGSAVSGWGLR